MKLKSKTLTQFYVIAALLISINGWPADKEKNDVHTYKDAAQALITKVQELMAKDTAEAFETYAKGAQELAKKFPNETGPLLMMNEAGSLIKDETLSANLTDKAKKGILAMLKKDPKDVEANTALLKLAENVTPEKAKEYLLQIANNGPDQIAQRAKGQLKNIEALGKPVEIAFTAIDGRKIDATKMKGKVVLVDFWATWCGPCIAELPDLKKTYAKYNNKGLEIIGISLDHSKDKLRKFIAKEEIPWPQQFDGLGWENKFAVKYGIRGIPTMWLIDKQGNLVDKNARATLDSKIEKLLKK
jgi:thiol-disulfide isomerase/thioredoxin